MDKGIASLFNPPKTMIPAQNGPQKVTLSCHALELKFYGKPAQGLKHKFTDV